MPRLLMVTKPSDDLVLEGANKSAQRLFNYDDSRRKSVDALYHYFTEEISN